MEEREDLVNSIATAVSRRTRMTTLAIATAAATTALVWAASSGSTSATSATVDTSAVLLAGADPLALADAQPRPLPGWLPMELRADLRQLRTMEPRQRGEAAERIWRDALAGEYGARVQFRAVEAQQRFQTLPEELRDDLKQLRGLEGDALRDARQEIRDKALDGEYGAEVEHWAERRSETRKQDGA